MVSIACTKPKDHDLAAELWTISALAKFVCERAEAAGFVRLANAGKSTVWRFLDDNDIKPHKISYYLVPARTPPIFQNSLPKSAYILSTLRFACCVQSLAQSDFPFS